MRIGTRLLFLLTGALVSGNIQIAYGNGRTTPPPSGASPIKAICSQRAGGQLQVFRVRLTNGDGSTETLNVTIGGVTEGMALRGIKRLRFLTSQINGDGFMKAAILRTDGTEETSAMVQVRSGGSKVRLTGFTSSGASVSIDLSSCTAVELSFAGGSATDSDYRPVKKE